jgi:FkbM family methyltransferase
LAQPDYKIEMTNKLESVEHFAKASKLTRFFSNPIKYLSGPGINKIFSAKSGKGRIIQVTTFFGVPFKVILPAGMDIYLTGGKTHDSELRLARFLINNLNPDDVFFDIGAHFGYYTLLASELLNKKGRVISFEPSYVFSLLHDNMLGRHNVEVYKIAITNVNDNIDFYEFPIKYSENNTKNISQFEKEEWYENNIPTNIKVEGKSLDQFSSETNLIPQVIKVDVEGEEHKVIEGAQQILIQNKPIVIIEYLAGSINSPHSIACMLLKKLNYTAYIINWEGSLKACVDIEQYMRLQNLHSDNLVFKV